MDELRQHDGSIAIECPQTQPMEECNNNDNLPGHQATESLLREAEGNIQVLKEQLYEKDCRITGLTTKGAERETRVTSLESQKMALETKVNYLQKQLQDMEGIKSKLKEVSNHSQGEVQQAKEELAKYKQRLALTESDLISTKRALEACQTELSLVRDELEASSSTLRDDNYRLGEALKAAEDLLGEEHAKCDDLFNQLAAANEQITQLQKMLTMKESELIRQSRATSVGSVRSPSLFSIEENGETIRRRPSNTTEHSLKALKGECERLAIENARLKATSQIEYIRNIILKYLQLPDQRKSLLPVLTNLFRFTDKELASIKK